MDAAERFVSAVIELRPRVAVFDCDGTLWDADSGMEFFYWEIEQGLLPEPVAKYALPRYKEYLQGKVSESTMCGEMVTIHAGIPLARLEEAATDFFRTRIAARIFPEMQRLTEELASQGCELWAVSSTNEWVVREGASRFRIPRERVLAAAVVMEGQIATDRLIRVPSGAGKADAIRKHINAPVDAVFGNAIWDAEMLKLAKHAFAINPNPDLEAVAQESGWTIYFPERRDPGVSAIHPLAV